MSTTRTVVVLEKASVLSHSESNLFAARFENLGLTAYGQTESEAVLELKKLFNKFVRTYREAGQLECRLDQTGVEWYWADEYPADKPPFEDTNATLRKSWQVVSARYDDANAMAA